MLILSEQEEAIKRDLNNHELREKFIKMAREKGWRYKNINFEDVKLQDNKVIIKIKTY